MHHLSYMGLVKVNPRYFDEELEMEDIRELRTEVVKKILGEEKTLDDLAWISMQCCGRHEADMQTIWFNMDGTEKFLREWLTTISNCGACGLIKTEVL